MEMYISPSLGIFEEEVGITEAILSGRSGMGMCKHTYMD